jgi:hypothetical protein
VLQHAEFGAYTVTARPDRLTTTQRKTLTWLVPEVGLSKVPASAR